MTISWSTMDTAAGPLTLLVDPADVVVAAGFTADVAALHRRLPGHDRRVGLVRRPELGAVTARARRYFAGELDAWDALPVRQSGGPFVEHTWRALRAVPAGQTVTYTELAARAGRPAAVRAAAMACARNLIAPIVPCHRVLRRDGALGGYYYGLPVKEWLLSHESENRQSIRPARATMES